MREDGDIRPALIASIALHLAVVVLCVLAMEFSPPVKVINVTPVTLITSAAEPNVKPAVQSPQTQSAESPQPTPSPEPPGPVETPTPAPSTPPPPPEPMPEPKPVLRPKPPPLPPVPRPQPPKVKPPPPKPPPPKPEPDLDLSSLAKTAPKRAPADLDLSSLAKTKAAHPSDLNLAALAGETASGHRGGASARGAFRPETDRMARQPVGAASALTGDELGALQAKLIPLWHPNCGVEGAQHVVIKVELKLDAAMHLAAPPKLLAQTSTGAPQGVVDAAAQRALTAAAQGAPYTELPRNAPRDIVLKFDAKQMCASE